MGKSSVYEGRTFDDAVRKGLEDLRLTRAEATITLVQEGKGGFLGLGARPYQVSIMRRPGGAVREPEEAPGRRVGGRRDERRSRGNGRDRGDRGDRPARVEGRRDEKRGPQPATAGAGRAEGRRDEKRDGRRDEKREGRRDEKREGRRPERREERPDERAARPQPVAAVNPPVVDDEELDEVAAVGVGPAGAIGAESAEGRRRRRRGRRGGRGRRRGGPEDGAHGPDDAPAARTPYEVASAPPADRDAFDPEPEMHAEPVMHAEPPAREDRPAPREDRPRRDEGFAEREDEPARVEPAAAAPGRAFEDRPRRDERGDDDRPRRDERPRREHRHDRPESGPGLPAAELADLSRKVTEDLLRAMGFDAKVTVAAEGTRADVTVQVEDERGLLTGREGETRQALQQLLNRFVNRGEGSRYHLQLEINDFWLQREQELADLARRLADEAVATDGETHTGFLSSQERRIVHMTLKTDPRVQTDSRGEDAKRFVVVVPARHSGAGAEGTE